MTSKYLHVKKNTFKKTEFNVDEEKCLLTNECISSTWKTNHWYVSSGINMNGLDMNIGNLYHIKASALESNDKI